MANQTNTTIKQYDAIVVGAGAGGGVIVGVLSEAGKRVLLLERGAMLSFGQVGRDHLRNMRLSKYGNNAGPDGPAHVRVWADSKTEEAVLPHENGYHNNAATVGGGTRVYGAQAWRFHPLDFRMATTYGVPGGSSLADWPIGYNDLAPFYERAEHELGVSGDSQTMTHLPTYARDYPMPPFPYNLQGQSLRRGADALGWQTTRIPIAINTHPYDGRAACVRCQHCVGFACPTDAKNGTQNTLIPRALLSGRCDLVTGAMVTGLETHSGRVVGVRYSVGTPGEAGATEVVAHAPVVALATGAIETARLLLRARLGNPDVVGRNLQGHYYPGAVGLFPEVVKDCVGPGVNLATTRFVHGNEGIVGGGMLADEFTVLPIIFWKRKTPPDLPRWGLAAKRWVQENYLRTMEVTGPVQEIPTPDSRVSLDPNVRDAWGNPVVRLSGVAHRETVRTSQFMHERAKEWLLACGATRVWGGAPGAFLSGGQHQAGTCRMGDDPETSVADRHCRVHGHDNLYLCDGSVHVTNGTFNPFLTIMALAYRSADHIKAHW